MSRKQTTKTHGEIAGVVAPEARPQRGDATDNVYVGLLDLANTLGPNSKLPPVRQLREQFGVSRSTLDAALDRLENQRILTRRERSGVFVAPHLSQHTVYVLCDPSYFLRNGSSPFWSLLIERIKAAAADEDILLSVAFANYSDEGELPDIGEDRTPIPDWMCMDVEAGKVQGIILVGLKNRVARWIEARGVPVVAYAGAAKFIVTTPGSDIVQMGVAALVRQGCSKICLWSVPDLHIGVSYRNFLEETFVGALRAHGLELQEGSFFRLPEGAAAQSTSYVHLGWTAAQHYFGLQSEMQGKFDGILSMDDMISQGGLMAMQRIGVPIGEQVRMATYANRYSPALLAWEDQITRMEIDLVELVGIILETLDALIEGNVERRLSFDPAEGNDRSIPERYRRVHPRLIPPLSG